MAYVNFSFRHIFSGSDSVRDVRPGSGEGADRVDGLVLEGRRLSYFEC